jgi:hypothetical protein
MIFKKKKKEEDEELAGIESEDEELEFKEFEEFEEELEKQKGLGPEEIEKNFIFSIERGCPICGSDVKGNDFYKYFCETCNILFDKKDILTKEFGKTLGEAHITKRRLTAEEKAALEKRRKELKERVFKTFSEKEKEELIEQAAERKTREEAAAEEEVLETQEPEGVEGAAEVTEETPEEQAEPEEGAEEEAAPEKEEYELEDESKIIASTQSTKMHTGQCHFVKKIHPQNRIYLGSVEEGKERGYEMCVCLRRMRARAR